MPFVLIISPLCWGFLLITASLQLNVSYLDGFINAFVLAWLKFTYSELAYEGLSSIYEDQCLDCPSILPCGAHLNWSKFGLHSWKSHQKCHGIVILIQTMLHWHYFPCFSSMRWLIAVGIVRAEVAFTCQATFPVSCDLIRPCIRALYGLIADNFVLNYNGISAVSRLRLFYLYRRCLLLREHQQWLNSFVG